eukprot:TRINITY_DN34365_c0_g1_i1.p1 TRINITY_DN34365_c0_g1~~TRINITY_DN34365_c0_g1_i1.p1  ORF type:complete len:305 (+),score=51.61 TRINITY_DN34365_c0_g1_i1:71-916(+)
MAGALQIYIRLPGGETRCVELAPDATAADLCAAAREAAEGEGGLRGDALSCTFQGEPLLPGPDMLADLGISAQSVISVVVSKGEPLRPGVPEVPEKDGVWMLDGADEDEDFPPTWKEEIRAACGQLGSVTGVHGTPVPFDCALVRVAVALRLIGVGSREHYHLSVGLWRGRTDGAGALVPHQGRATGKVVAISPLVAAQVQPGSRTWLAAATLEEPMHAKEGDRVLFTFTDRGVQVVYTNNHKGEVAWYEVSCGRTAAQGEEIRVTPTSCSLVFQAEVRRC